MTKNTTRRRGLAAVAALIATAGLLVVAAPSDAVHNTGAFELDGNAVNGAALGDDWDNVCHQVNPTACPTGSNTTGATAVDWLAEPNLNASIFTGGGSKDPQDVSQWAWKDAGGLPDKDNLLNSFAARYNTSDGDVLFFGSDRYDNSGDAQQGFWFFQNSIALGTNAVGGGSGFSGVHRAGDLLVISDFSNGGSVSSITVYSWDTTCTRAGGTCGDANLRTLASSSTAKCLTATASDGFCGQVNSDTITMPWSFTDKSKTPNNQALNGEFYEGGVNLSRLGLADRCFASVASETRSSTSTTATLKDFILGGFGSCGSTLTTHSTPSAPTSISTGSVSTTDSATLVVTGIGAWNGTVQFTLTGPTGISSVAAPIGGPVAISNLNSTVSSVSANVTAAGAYCWSAHFTSATNGVPDDDDDALNECFTVTPVTPALTTTAGADVVLGNPVTDTAGLSGTSNQPGSPIINPTTSGAAAGGTIKFTLLNADCTTLAAGTGTNPQSVTVSGDNAAYGPVSFTPNAIGTYYWKAEYIPAVGDPNNLGSVHNADCSDTNEDVVVKSVKSSMLTAQSFIPNDSATVSAPEGGPLAGKVTFTVYASSDCTGTVIHTQEVAVSGASSQTVFTTNTTHSTTSANVSWMVQYDSTNPAQQSIAATCVEKTLLTITNGGTVSSP